MISQGSSKRLLLAGRTRQSIRHPHLVPARVVQDEQGRVRILLQRFEVPTLSEVLSKGPVPIPNCLRMLYGIASAVEALTAEGLVARDLDPDRIFVCPRRGALLADPGIHLDVLPRGAVPDRASAFLEPRSVYHLTGAARYEWEHSIAEMAVTRWSITFRSLSDKAHGMRPILRADRLE